MCIKDVAEITRALCEIPMMSHVFKARKARLGVCYSTKDSSFVVMRFGKTSCEAGLLRLFVYRRSLSTYVQYLLRYADSEISMVEDLY